jgi:hypothetical protein
MGTFSNYSNSYRYIFDKSSKKHLCPKCNKRRFVLYVDTVTGNLLPEQYGRCDRESECSQHLNPYLDGYAKMIWEQENGITESTKITVQKKTFSQRNPKPQPTPEPVFFDFDTFKQTLEPERYEKNTFIQNLLTKVAFPFDAVEVTKVIQLYRLGTVANGYRAGANTFPFIDVQGNIRAVQVKQFDEQNHTTGTDFLHSIIEKHHTRNNKPLPEWLEAYNKNETKVSCLFGEHNLNKYSNANIFLFEAPKTAIYSTLYFGFPEQSNILCLAVYNLRSLNLNKCKALKGRNVYLFPDLSKDGKAFELWSNKANKIQKRLQGTYFHVSDLLEQLAPQQDKEQGKDIADYLIKQDWRLFRKQDIKEAPQPEPEPIKTSTREKSEKSEAQKKTFFSQPELLPKVEVFQPEPIIREQPQNWSNDIAELENYFASIELPTQPVKLNRCSTITDCSLFIESHFANVKANDGKRTFLPYLNRLQELKQVLTTKF